MHLWIFHHLPFNIVIPKLVCMWKVTTKHPWSCNQLTALDMRETIPLQWKGLVSVFALHYIIYSCYEKKKKNGKKLKQIEVLSQWGKTCLDFRVKTEEGYIHKSEIQRVLNCQFLSICFLFLLLHFLKFSIGI